MSLSFDIDAQQVKQLANDIDTQGFAVLKGAFSDTELQQLRAYTDHHADLHPGEYFAYHGEQSLAGSLLYNVWGNPNFKTLMAGLYRNAAGACSRSGQILPVLRCVQGRQGQRESNCFHYDASLVTALIPIFIPQEGEERGDLILFPNLRKVRPSVVLNVIEKALLQNRLSRKLVCHAINKGWLKPQTLLLEPGNIYFFWGYRSLHANRPVGLELKRATALFHFGDPHTGSLAVKWILKFNQRRARLASRKSSNPKQEPTPG
ncbi:hypothetical protein [Pseudomonas sp. NA-150]|uniref:hypothetical protein n=1 Tax=Pseudomonas sp. NA-150 TaxID=3367525 RepID=UPI0037C897A6